MDPLHFTALHCPALHCTALHFKKKEIQSRRHFAPTKDSRVLVALIIICWYFWIESKVKAKLDFAD